MGDGGCGLEAERAGGGSALALVRRRLDAGQLEQILDRLFRCAVKHRRCHRHTVSQVTGQLHELVVVQGLQVLDATGTVVVHGLQELANLGSLLLFLDHCVDLVAKALGSQAQVGLQNLSDVHTRWYTQWVQHNINRRSIWEERHIFNRRHI